MKVNPRVINPIRDETLVDLFNEKLKSWRTRYKQGQEGTAKKSPQAITQASRAFRLNQLYPGILSWVIDPNRDKAIPTDIVEAMVNDYRAQTKQTPTLLLNMLLANSL